MQDDEGLEYLRARLGELLGAEATALQRAITLSQSDAAQTEVGVAIRNAESVRADRLEVAPKIAAKSAES
jgi:hypothetical protein